MGQQSWVGLAIFFILVGRLLVEHLLVEHLLVEGPASKSLLINGYDWSSKSVQKAESTHE